MGHRRQTRMPMYDLDVFAQYDGTEVGEEREEVGQGRRGRDRGEREVVHFEMRQEVSNPYSIRRMAVSYHNYLMNM